MFYGVTDIKTFILGTILIIILPGANSVYIMSTSARHGILAGYKGAAGVFFGDLILMILTATGVASVLNANPIAFIAIKYFGALYLAYMGLNMFRNAVDMWREKVKEISINDTYRSSNPFFGALMISLTNPKAILFYVSFFIQFVSPDYDIPALSFFILGSIVQICTFIYLSILIFCGSLLANTFRRQRKMSAFAMGCVGGAFITFGSKLASSSMN